VRGMGSLPSGSPNGSSAASPSAPEIRWGSRSRLRRGRIVSRTGRGGGQASGQYEVEIATRSRGPTGNGCAAPWRCTCATSRWAGYVGRWLGVTLGVGAVEAPVAGPGAASIWSNIGQPRGAHRDRFGRGEFEFHHRRAEDLRGFGELIGIEHEGTAVVFTLVIGQVGRGVIGAPLASVLPDRERGLDV